MKKKMEKLRRDGRLEGNTTFEALWNDYQSAENAFEQAKTDRKIAKSTYHFELDVTGSKDDDQRDKLFELNVAVLRAEGQRLIRRADYQLAKYRLHRWIDAFARLPKASTTSDKAVKTRSNGQATKAKTPKTKRKGPAAGPALPSSEKLASRRSKTKAAAAPAAPKTPRKTKGKS